MDLICSTVKLTYHGGKRNVFIGYRSVGENQLKRVERTACVMVSLDILFVTEVQGINCGKRTDLSKHQVLWTQKLVTTFSSEEEEASRLTIPIVPMNTNRTILLRFISYLDSSSCTDIVAEKV